MMSGAVFCLLNVVARIAVTTAMESAEKRIPFKSTFTKAYRRSFALANKEE